MKRFYKIFASWFLCLFLVLTQFIVSFADVKSLMIGSSSNALMTMELDDDDYAVMPMSSIGTVTNTVNYNYVVCDVEYVDDSGSTKAISIVPSYSGGRFHVKKLDIPGDATRFVIKLYGGSIPSAGSYLFSWDMSSNFSYTYTSRPYMYAYKNIKNAQIQSGDVILDGFLQSSGDFYLSNFGVTYTSLDYVSIGVWFTDSGVRNIDYSFALNYKKVPNDSSYPILVGSGTATENYQSDVSSSLSDLSSSVDTMTDEISGVTEAIQNLQGAMEPHYSNVLTQLHHITEQLHAFYDQVYNNIHLPELDMLTQIKTAIENIDLQIEVDISEVKTAINNMSMAVQNKLQATTDQITGGYDNSSMSSDKSELDGVLDQYEQAEEQLFDDAQGHINDFEFNTPLDSFTGPLADVSYFLNGMFEAMGPMNVVISFSLTLTIAMVMIGWYRFKGGR